MAAGLHVPVIAFVEVAGSVGAAVPLQKGGIALNVGMVLGVTVTVREAVVAHCVTAGVKVYVPVVVLLTVAGLQVPVTPLVEVAGNTGAAAPEQIGAIAAKAGITCGVTFTVIVTG